MKAIRISRTGGREVLEHVDVADPAVADGEVLIKTEAISVNFADVLTRQGTYPVMPALPAVIGLEGSGVIEAVGRGVSGLREGQRVSFLGPGAYADRVAVAASSVIPLPDEIDFDTGAAYPVVYLTAFHLMHTMGSIRQGDWVVIPAPLGGVGTAATQLARIAGVNVIGITSTREKAEAARGLGVEHVYTYDQPDLVAEVMRATEGKGAKVVLDSVAGPHLPRHIDMLAPLGQVLWFGFAAGLPDPGAMMEALGRNFVKGVGVRSFHLFYSVAAPYPELFGPSVGTILRYLLEKKIQPVIADRIPLGEAARAHELLESRQTVGKLLLKP